MPNLLPENEKKNLYKLYRARVIMLALLGVIFLSILSSVLLFPSYLLSRSKLQSAQNSLGILKESVTYRESRNIEEQVNKSQAYLSAVTPVIKNSSVPTLILEIIDIAPPGIEVSSINFRKVSDTSFEISVGGEADARESLLSYLESLKADERLSSVDLPISNLAKDRDISFNLTITINKN